MIAHAVTARALLNAMRAQGVSDREICTETAQLNPVYDYDESGNSYLAGFQAARAASGASPILFSSCRADRTDPVPHGVRLTRVESRRAGLVPPQARTHRT